MCIAIQEIREEGRQEGWQQGRIEGIILAYKEMGHSQEGSEKLSYNGNSEKNDEEAACLIKKYWK